MRILRLEASNIKKLTAVEITPDGNLIQITGPNESGKTSVLDAIFWALAGTKHIDSQPIRRGEESAKIRLNLGDGTDTELIVTRTFSTTGPSKVMVESTEGARFPSPQSMLDKLLGSLTFDPLAFARATPAEQLDMLRKLVTLEIDIDKLDFDYRRLFEERTEINRTVKHFTERVKAIEVPDGPEPINVEPIMARLEGASAQNIAAVKRTNEGTYLRDMIRDRKADAQRHRELAAEEERKAEVFEGELAALMMQPAIEMIDEAALRAELRDAMQVNEVASARKAAETNRNAMRGELTDAESKSEVLTGRMEALQATRRNAIAAAEMPITGLGFGEGEVTYNDLPFAQASGAQQLKVSMAIAMAANPKLRVLRIKDASLLDQDSLAMIADLADAHDYQVWLEMVDTSGTVGIVMEDGHIAGQ
jgi:DNA repair exonuclease SbcCD ATPase subunit